MQTLEARLALPEPRASRIAFDRAAATFERACFVHDWARQRLIERLDLVRLIPATVADVGCAVGKGATVLAQRYPQARVLGLDTSVAMLSRAHAAAGAAATWLIGDAERLPLRDGCIDLMLANLVLPWCEPPAFFAQARRTLRPGGLLTFATLGPDTLQEVRRAWGAADDRIHVHAAFDMHDLGDAAIDAGLSEPVLDVERIELTYRDAGALVADLRGCGGVNTAAGRRKTLTSPNRWRAFADSLQARRAGGRFAVTVEVILGQAWGGPAGKVRSAAGEIVVPLEHVRRKKSAGVRSGARYTRAGAEDIGENR